MLLALVQQASPGARDGLLHEGNGLSSLKFGEQEKLGMKPYAITLVITTPIGWKIESKASKKRLFCGMNSRQMVVSMGMLPPIPKPLNAVTTRKAV